MYSADHGTDQMYSADHGTDQMYNADHGTDQMYSADHGTDQMYNADHGVLSVNLLSADCTADDMTSQLRAMSLVSCRISWV